jgi:hypothetical protein
VAGAVAVSELPAAGVSVLDEQPNSIAAIKITDINDAILFSFFISFLSFSFIPSFETNQLFPIT